MSGGKFGHGFFAAGAVAGLKGPNSDFRIGTKPSLKFARLAIAGVVGGTVSELTGGKFRNGALTGAMTHLFNAENAIARENAQKGNPGVSVRDKALEDGHLTLNEANAIRRANNDPNLEVDVLASKLSVSPDGEVVNNSEVNARVQGLGDWLVHGNVRLRTVDGVTTINRERYDFDIKSWKGNTARNIETILGRTYAGDGVDFWINFSGSPQIDGK